MVEPRFDFYIDEDAELAKPKPLPLREPRLASPIEDIEDAPPQSPTTHPAFASEDDGSELSMKPESTRKKHESYDFLGSVFLITGDGRTLNLPIPSDSNLDPLNWGAWKTAGAVLAIGWYSAVTLTVAQAMSLMMKGIMADFTEAVSSALLLLPQILTNGIGNRAMDA
jgi:hypothetical protein